MVPFLSTNLALVFPGTNVAVKVVFLATERTGAFSSALSGNMVEVDPVADQGVNLVFVSWHFYLVRKAVTICMYAIKARRTRIHVPKNWTSYLMLISSSVIVLV